MAERQAARAGLDRALASPHDQTTNFGNLHQEVGGLEVKDTSALLVLRLVSFTELAFIVVISSSGNLGAYWGRGGGGAHCTGFL